MDDEKRDDCIPYEHFETCLPCKKERWCLVRWEELIVDDSLPIPQDTQQNLLGRYPEVADRLSRLTAIAP
ncbi:hypothetical protein RB195_014073 [Necator americanus]|uniref:Uncharacterized protein n=1 Tax=Necator americanus TaxID=51031 RepID=A0ABR1DYI7_NECAM